jgi:peptide/nickel transport system ATP-binding protein
MAILFVSHDLRAVRQVSHRVAVMYLGRIVEEGEPDAVLHAPAHPYAQALVSAIPHPGRRAGGLHPRILLQGDPPNPADRPGGCAFHPRCAAAVPRCATDDPLLKPRAGDGRRVACHVAHGEAEAPSDAGNPARRDGLRLASASQAA